MIFNKVLGNIDKYKNLDNFHIEKIYINSDDALKRILRVNSDHNHEYGIALDENVELKDGDILYKDDKNNYINIGKSSLYYNCLLEDDKQNLGFYDLDMYHPQNTMNSKILSQINKSIIDENIILNKNQIEILNILKNRNLFLSAPTSFGKTFFNA